METSGSLGRSTGEGWCRSALIGTGIEHGMFSAHAFYTSPGHAHLRAVMLGMSCLPAGMTRRLRFSDALCC